MADINIDLLLKMKKKTLQLFFSQETIKIKWCVKCALQKCSLSYLVFLMLQMNVMQILWIFIWHFYGYSTIMFKVMYWIKNNCIMSHVSIVYCIVKGVYNSSHNNFVIFFFPEANKHLIVTGNGVRPLLGLMMSQDTRVQRNASGAILNLTHLRKIFF